MKLVLIFGDSAVGKMTVGQELCKITDLRLFHNHMSIEMVLEVFGSFHQDAILKLRNVIFEEFAKTDNYGLVFTFMWAFEEQEDWDIVKGITDIFEQQNAEIYYVELDASLEVRLERNKTENRLKNKASKRNIELSESYLMKDYHKH
ncbi:MAG: AAA family ATPase, partial [Anaeroplasmataceae bacterium]|nr:AAA family ATPase [Anaeroplasmataceae bacterium]